MRALLDLLRRTRRYADLTDEIQAHLDEKVDALVAGGMPRGDAVLLARRTFGNRTTIAEAGRDVWRLPAVDDFLADVAHAVRLLRRSPVFTAVAIFSLAIGIGASTAVFAVLDALLLRPLHVAEPADLVVFARQDPEIGRPNPLTFHEYRELLARARSFSGLLAHSGGDAVLQPGATAGPDAGGRIRAGRVSTNFFEVLGVRMSLGRGFTPVNDEAADPERSVVLSYAYWRRHFGGDPSIIGKPMIVFRGIPFTVIGVAEPGFRGIEADRSTDAWWPVGTARLMSMDRLREWTVTVMGRLKPGVEIDQAGAEARVLHSAIAALEADEHADWSAARRRRFEAQRLTVAPGATGVADELRSRFTQPLYVLMASVAALLLVAALNVGALLLARTTARRGELAVRVALGGPRGRIIRQLVTENALLALIATAAGIALAPVAVRLILGYAPPQAATLDLTADLRTVLVVVLLAAVTAVLIGVLPAIRSTAALQGPVGSGTRGDGGGGARQTARVHRWLVASQVAASMALLVVAGLFARTLHNLRDLDPGFDRKGLVLVTVNQGAVTAAAARRIAPALEAIPGVRSATFYANLGLLGGGSVTSDCVVDGTQPAASDQVSCVMMQVGPRFFETTSTPIVAGRAFLPGDDAAGAAVAIINETMAREYFGSESALGRRIQGKQVIGVARDTKYTTLRDPAQRMLYTPVTTAWVVADVRFALRTDLGSVALTGAVRRAVSEVDASRAVTAVQSIADIAEGTLARERLLAEVATSFGLLALLLACIGLYGTLSFAVARRTREIGIRIALGASRASIIGQVMGESGTTVGAGAIAGLAATLGVSRLLSRFLFGLAPDDPATIGAAVVLLGAAAAVAAYLPARRASGTDPLAALRSE
jgi:predicted permease